MNGNSSGGAPALRDGSSSSPNVLDITDLTIEFNGRSGLVQAVEDVNISCAPGEFIAIVGPSGCGKSSLLKVIAGLSSASSGEVMVRGKRVQGPPDSLWMMFQTPVLLDWLSVEDNIALPLRQNGASKQAARVTAHELLEKVNLRASARNMPCELSGGMQQRVALCRALATQPTLLLMDEPLSALDALMRDQLTYEIQSIWMSEHFSGVLVTHSIVEAVTLADKIIIMSNVRPGRIVDVVNVDLERPRTRRSRNEPAFQTVVNNISEILYAHGGYEDEGGIYE